MRQEKVLELSYFQMSRILLSAVELDIFPLLHEPADALFVAGERGLDPDTTGRLLNALVAMKILVLDDDKYVIPDELKEAFGDGPRSIIPMLRHRARLWTVWSSLTEIVRTGKNYYELHESHSDHFENLPNFIRAMAVSGRKSASETVALLDLEGVESVLDIGGGPAIYASEFCRILPDAIVCILDFPSVGDVANEFLEDPSHKERVSFVEGNVLDIEDSKVIGEDDSGKYDLIFMSNLIHSFSPDDVRKLIKRCVRWCRPGGRIAIKDFFLDDTRTSPDRAAMFDINMLTATRDGRSYTWSEVEMRLTEIKDKNGNPLVNDISRIQLSDGYSGIIVADMR